MSLRVRKATPLAFALLLLLPPAAGCRSADEADEADGPERSTTSTTEPPGTSDSTTPPTSDTTSPTPVTEPPWTPSELLPSGEEAMARLVDAWRAEDRAAAARLAPPDAVEALFRVPADGYAPYQQCGDADFGQQLCAYRNRSQGGFVQFQMEEQPGAGWYVISVAVDPTG